MRYELGGIESWFYGCLGLVHWDSCMAPGKSSIPFELQVRTGVCSPVTAGQNRPHLRLCPGPSVPLLGRQGSQGCILDSPGESGLVFLAWKIPWTEEPGGLQFMRSQRVGYSWACTCQRRTHKSLVYHYPSPITLISPLVIETINATNIQNHYHSLSPYSAPHS